MHTGVVDGSTTCAFVRVRTFFRFGRISALQISEQDAKTQHPNLVSARIGTIFVGAARRDTDKRPRTGADRIGSQTRNG